jgi:hypothetical protein
MHTEFWCWNFWYQGREVGRYATVESPAEENKTGYFYCIEIIVFFFLRKETQNGGERGVQMETFACPCLSFYKEVICHL